MHRLDGFPKNDLIQQYRNVFASREGADVLAHMLFDLGVFQEVAVGSTEDAALKNYAVRLLRILGGGEVGLMAAKALARQVMTQPLEEQKSIDD